MTVNPDPVVRGCQERIRRDRYRSPADGTKRRLPGLSLLPKDRVFCELIASGMDAATAKRRAGFAPTHSLTRLLGKSSVQNFLQWADQRRVVSSETCEKDALVRLSKLLQDEKTPPMVAAVCCRIALAHRERILGLGEELWRKGEEGGEYLEAVVKIRRKIESAKVMDLRQLEVFAGGVTEKKPEAGPTKSELSYPEEAAHEGRGRHDGRQE